MDGTSQSDEGPVASRLRSAAHRQKEEMRHIKECCLSFQQRGLIDTNNRNWERDLVRYVRRSLEENIYGANGAAYQDNRSLHDKIDEAFQELLQEERAG